MNRLFLIDAYALIYRSYFAFINTPRVNSKGLNTSTMLGFVNTLEQLLKTENPTHIAVAFDMKGPTFRHDMFVDYKSQREEMPEDIRKSVPYIRRIISGYNIPILEKEGFEADDVIGTLAKEFEKLDYQVYMVTPDKDYSQLVSKNIFMVLQCTIRTCLSAPAEKCALAIFCFGSYLIQSFILQRHTGRIFAGRLDCAAYRFKILAKTGWHCRTLNLFTDCQSVKNRSRKHE